MTKSIGIYSRDSRTDMQFRHSWKEVICDAGLRYHTVTRRDSGLSYIIYVLWDCLLKRKMIAFGVSEILILAIFRPNIIVVTGFGRLLDKSSRYRKFIFFILKLFYRNTPVIVLNSHDKRVLLKVGFKKTFQISGEGYISRVSHAPDGNLEHLGAINLLYIGRLLKSKGVDSLIEYFEYLRANFRTAVTLTLIGDTDYGSSDAIDINKVKEKHKIGFRHINYTRDLEKFLNENYIFVSLSKREGLSFSVLEALDGGCSAVLSHVPGNAEFRGYNRVRTIRSRDDLFKLSVGELFKMRREIKSDLSKFHISNVKSEIQNILSNVCIL